MKATFHLRWALAIAFVAALTAHAADPPEMVAAKAQYQAAVAKFTELYKSQLQALQRKFLAAKDNASLVAVSEELARIDGGSSALPAPVAKPPIGTVSPKDDSAPGMGATSLFVGRAWHSTIGAKYYFKDDGTGYREHQDDKVPFTWTKTPENLIEVKGRKVKAADAPIITWYFQFTNRKTALFGVSKTNMPDTLSTDR